MPTPATYDDVNLIMRLYEARREDKLRQAREWFASMFKARNLEEFNRACPAGSGPNTYFRMVVSYWEMAASFITSGVLNEELFFQSSGELLVVWVKIRDIVPEFRAFAKNRNIYKNLETVAQRYIQYYNRDNPDAFNSFIERVVGAPARKS